MSGPHGTDGSGPAGQRVASFGADTAVRPRDGGRWAATLTDRWQVFGGAAPNGGYLMAIAARAMRSEADAPDPLSLTAHFLRPPAIGDVEVTTAVVKRGRRITTVAASLAQGERECVRLLGAFGDLGNQHGPTLDHRAPPELPPLEDCVDLNAEADAQRAAGRGERMPPIIDRYDHRVPRDSIGWALGRPTGQGELAGWLRFAGDEPVDPIGLVAVADAMPPAVFDSGLPLGWVPTVELTVHVRKRPAPGWLRARFASRSITRGLLEEDGEIFDSAGDLVALSRQLALVARTTGSPEGASRME